jgi:hypothetical protein
VETRIGGYFFGFALQDLKSRIKALFRFLDPFLIGNWAASGKFAALPAFLARFPLVRVYQIAM